MPTIPNDFSGSKRDKDGELLCLCPHLHRKPDVLMICSLMPGLNGVVFIVEAR